MADVFSPAKRSAVMAKIRGTGNRSTELALVSGFRSAHVRGWRRHVVFEFQIPSVGAPATKPTVVRVRPDFIFLAAKLAVFVDGCFWHCCPLHSKVPESNSAYWEPKLKANAVRDLRATRLLRRAGWSVMRLWEHEMRDIDSAVRKVRTRLSARLRREPSIA